MSKNITNGFNYRQITRQDGSNGGLSPHASRTVLDINPLWNPFFEPHYIDKENKSNGLAPGPYKELTPPNTPYRTVESWYKNEPSLYALGNLVVSHFWLMKQKR